MMDTPTNIGAREADEHASRDGAVMLDKQPESTVPLLVMPDGERHELEIGPEGWRAAARPAGTRTPPAPQLEERPWPPFAAELIREVLERHRREFSAHVEQIAKACGVSITEGWMPDPENGRFVRAAAPVLAE